SYHTWRDGYGLDPTLVGAAITINGVPCTVIGIAAPDFLGDTLRSNPPDFWLPFGSEPALRTSSLLASKEQAWVYSIGRLPSRANPQQVQARLTATLQQWLTDEANVPASYRSQLPQQHITLTPGGSGVTTMTARYGDGLQI